MHQTPQCPMSSLPCYGAEQPSLLLLLSQSDSCSSPVPSPWALAVTCCLSPAAHSSVPALQACTAEPRLAPQLPCDGPVVSAQPQGALLECWRGTPGDFCAGSQRRAPTWSHGALHGLWGWQEGHPLGTGEGLSTCPGPPTVDSISGWSGGGGSPAK